MNKLKRQRLYFIKYFTIYSVDIDYAFEYLKEKALLRIDNKINKLLMTTKIRTFRQLSTIARYSRKKDVGKILKYNYFCYIKKLKNKVDDNIISYHSAVKSINSCNTNVTKGVDLY